MWYFLMNTNSEKSRKKCMFNERWVLDQKILVLLWFLCLFDNFNNNRDFIKRQPKCLIYLLSYLFFYGTNIAWVKKEKLYRELYNNNKFTPNIFFNIFQSCIIIEIMWKMFSASKTKTLTWHFCTKYNRRICKAKNNNNKCKC